nr:LTA synthase family protein [Peribacillus deserti]
MARGKNIIIVQLESVQDFLINLKIDGKPITPNLNKLAESSLYFPNVYTQVGKGNTSDAEFITNTSLYALGDIPMSSAVEGKTVPSLPRALGKLGYHSATFHANGASFWNRKNMYKSLGFDDYYDKQYFGTSDIISYGVSDEVMYQKTAEKLAEFHEKDKKFYADVIALSSHFPYHLPADKKKFAIQLPTRYNQSFIGSYIEAVSYADYAFGKFVSELKKWGLYDDTLLIVYGDHQGVQTKSSKDSELLQEIFGREYQNPLDHLNIPLIIKIPGVTEGKTIETTGGLVDIYPTAANILGLDIKKQMIFGTDLVNTKMNTIGIRFYTPTGTYITDSFHFSPGKTQDEGRVTSLKTRKTVPASPDSLNRMNQMLKYMKQSDRYVESLK